MRFGGSIVCTMGVGQRLRDIRERRKLTQEQLARDAGVTQPSISELETGETKEISGPVLISISRALKINPIWLMTGEGQEELNIVLHASERGRRILEVFEESNDQAKATLFQVANALAQPKNNPAASQ